MILKQKKKYNVSYLLRIKSSSLYCFLRLLSLVVIVREPYTEYLGKEVLILYWYTFYREIVRVVFQTSGSLSTIDHVRCRNASAGLFFFLIPFETHLRFCQDELAVNFQEYNFPHSLGLGTTRSCHSGSNISLLTKWYYHNLFIDAKEIGNTS